MSFKKKKKNYKKILSAKSWAWEREDIPSGSTGR